MQITNYIRKIVTPSHSILASHYILFIINNLIYVLLCQELLTVNFAMNFDNVLFFITNRFFVYLYCHLTNEVAYYHCTGQKISWI